MTLKRSANVHWFTILLFLFTLFFSQARSQQLYGIAYSPYRRFGHCPTAQELAQDNAIGSLHTRRIRLYSTECHYLNDVYLGAASVSGPSAKPIEVLMGVWIDGKHERDNKEIQDLYIYLRRYPHAKLSGIAVGNEVLYRKTMHPNDLARKVLEVKNTVRQIGRESGSSSLLTVPVFSVDVIPHPAVVAVSDAIGVNVHPFYRRDIAHNSDSNIMSDLALASSIQQINLFSSWYGGMEIFVTETGWPSSSAPHELHRGDLQVSKLYMQKFSAWAATANVKYWWFELFDSPWKTHQYPNEPQTMSEFHWGIYNEHRVKK
eukprot:g3581.t1